MAARIVLLRNRSKAWIAAVAVSLATLVIAALILPNSFRLTALSDVVQCILLLSGTIALIQRASAARARSRLFWALMATGIFFWFSYQMFWTYYEVWLRTDVPELCAADVIMFLHIVPLMAALALRPHALQDEYAARLRRLDFALLIVWWGYLYVLIVIPWQYVVADIPVYNANLNALYSIEKFVFLGTLFMAWIGSKEGWKTFYANLFGASFIYAASSHLANWAIGRHLYYSGSLYDIPLAASMAWITLIGLRSRQSEPQSDLRSTSTSFSVWLARLGMIAVFSLPLFAAWALLNGPIPPRIRSFRLALTLAAALFMGIMVFVRQRLLDRELLRLLTYSRESLANLKRLQEQITESEKLASIGQLVGGAAHELNNPLTAMLGYSDLLMNTALNPEQNELARKIGRHVRHTKALVASLLSFAKQGPLAMASVDLNPVLRTAVKLSQPQWQALKIEVSTVFPPEPLPVRGDSNLLLQVCLQVINDALRAADQQNNRTLTIAAEQKDGIAIINISDAPAAVSLSENPPVAIAENNMAENNENQAVDLVETFSGLGLSTCQGILQQHDGRILWLRNRNAGTTVRIEIPVIPPPLEKSPESGVPVMWQPQPFA